MDKVKHSIELIRKAEKLALTYNDFGFHLAFSGGKDSQVIYELAKMAGVKFKPVMSITTIDPPQLMRFIRENYPDVCFIRPEINFYDLIVKKKALPTRKMRFCCEYLKEQAGSNAVVITGIRKAESNRRKKRNEMEVSNHKYSDTLDQFNIDFESKTLCVNGKDKIILNPIINWSDMDVWRFIRNNKIKYCKLYDEGYKRIGCIFCPMGSKKQKVKDRMRYPKIEAKIKECIAKLTTINNYGSTLNCDVDDIFEWWVSNDTIAQYKANKLQYTIEYAEQLSEY